MIHIYAYYGAKQETVEKVSKIVKKQLSLKDDQRVVAETKFTDLGADSIGTKNHRRFSGGSC
ncbi:hypothetical protein YC2023_050421 [Brassica napus]